MFIEPYLSNITIFAGNFAPRQWAFCNGDLISIASNESLFALIGTTYGGDGMETFALPDLRGRSAIHAGQGGGLPTYSIGEIGGSETNTLTTANLPPHNHMITSITGTPGASSDGGDQSSPVGHVPAQGIANRYNTTSDLGMAPSVITASSAIAGGNTPVDNLSPYLAMNYIICVEGIFPSRH